MRLPSLRQFRLTSILLLIALALSLLPLAVGAAGGNPPTCSGQIYTVRAGDTWWKVAQYFGLSTRELVTANPHAVRRNRWLYLGDQLCIPARTDAQGSWYTVKPGDSWGSIAKATGLSVSVLQQANSGLLNLKGWLYIGQRVWLPSTTAAPTEAQPAKPIAGTTPTTPVGGVTPTPSPTASTGANCPDALAGYPDAILAYLNTAGNQPDGLTQWLIACNAISDQAGGVTRANLQSAKSADLVVAVHTTSGDPATGQGVLAIYHAGAKGYTLARQAQGTGLVKVLKVGDVNADGKMDIIWTDTTCGAHTCFSTLFVDSWDGSAYQDWIAGEPTLASADYKFADTTPDGSGAEISAYGGVIGSVGAGPQRAWTETYASKQGAPYELVSQVYDASSCLYHQILDANTAFTAWAKEGFDPAIAGYEAAISDQKAEACGSLDDELNTLRDFARFRLIVAYVGAGRSTEAAPLVSEIAHVGLHGAAETFLNAYKSSGSAIQACRDTNTYAQATPDAWQFLADWGYANPTFAAEELCPLN